MSPAYSAVITCWPGEKIAHKSGVVKVAFAFPPTLASIASPIFCRPFVVTSLNVTFPVGRHGAGAVGGVTASVGHHCGSVTKPGSFAVTLAVKAIGSFNPGRAQA